MKKILPYILITAIFLGAFAPVAESGRVYAETPSNLEPLTGSVPTYQPPANQPRPIEGDKSTTKGCVGLPSGINFDACVANLVYIGMTVVSWILWLSGKIFDITVAYTLHLSELVKATKMVDIGWVIFRDLANIAFIFILLWVAINTILGINSGETKKLITHIIVVALLINFSLFITKAIIDASNIVALHFYGLIVAQPPPQNIGETDQDALFRGLIPKNSFSAAFMEGLKIQTIYNPNDQNSNTTGTNFMNIIIIGLFGSGLMLVAAYVFFAATILFVIRAVVLIFLMILSPIAFIGYVLPGAEGITHEWWHKLTSESLFAPAYLALAFVVVKIIQSGALTTLGGAGSTFRGVAATGSSAGIVVGFIILIAMMLGCLLIAKKMGAVGAETATHWANNASSFVGRNALRTGFGVGGASTLGAMAIRKVFPKSERFQKIAQRMDNFGKKADITEVDRAFGKTKFGQTVIGEKVRAYTTGAAVHAKFGGEKSAEQTREEDDRRRERLEEINDKNAVKQQVGDLKAAQESEKTYEMPTGKQFTDKETGEFDSKGFETAFQKHLETFRPQRKDYEDGQAGDAKFAAAQKLYDDKIQSAPLRSYIDDKGKKGDEAFLKQVMEYENKHFASPSSAIYTNPAELKTAEEIAYSQIARKDKEKEKTEELKSVIGFMMNKLTPRGFAEMSEHDISALSGLASTKQIDAVLESKEWTKEEKIEMLGPRYDKPIGGFENFQAEYDAYLVRLKILEAAQGRREFELDEKGNIMKKETINGKQYARKVTRDSDGKVTGNVDGPDGLVEIPTEPSLPKELREWVRNDMTLHDFEIMATVRSKAYDIPSLAAAIRHPIIFKELRKSPILSFATRNNLTYLKDRKLYSRLIDRDSNDYLEENSEEERVAAYKKAEEAAVATNKGALKANQSVTEAARMATKAYKKIIANMLSKDMLREQWLQSWRSDRSPDEIASTRGRGRNNPVVHSIINAGTMRHWDGKDTSDIKQMLASLIVAYAKDKKGISKMTNDQKDALRWLLTNKESGQHFNKPELVDNGELASVEYYDKDGKKKVGYKDGKVEIVVEVGKDGKATKTETVVLQDVFEELQSEVEAADNKITFESDKRMRGLGGNQGQNQPQSANQNPPQPQQGGQPSGGGQGWQPTGPTGLGPSKKNI